MRQTLEPVEVVVGEEVVKEDEEELRQRQERSAVIVQEMSDLVNYVIPKTFTVRSSCMGRITAAPTLRKSIVSAYFAAITLGFRAS